MVPDGRQASDQLKDLTKNATALRIGLAETYQTNNAGKIAGIGEKFGKILKRVSKQ